MQLVQDSIYSNGGKLVDLNLVYSHSAGQSVRLLRRFKDLPLLHRVLSRVLEIKGMSCLQVKLYDPSAVVRTEPHNLLCSSAMKWEEYLLTHSADVTVEIQYQSQNVLVG